MVQVYGESIERIRKGTAYHPAIVSLTIATSRRIDEIFLHVRFIAAGGYL